MHLLERIQALAPHYRTRPSALGPLLRVTGGALGALSVLLPRPYSEAIKGNDTLRYVRGIVIGRNVLSWRESQVCRRTDLLLVCVGTDGAVKAPAEQ